MYLSLQDGLLKTEQILRAHVTGRHWDVRMLVVVGAPLCSACACVFHAFHHTRVCNRTALTETPSSQQPDQHQPVPGLGTNSTLAAGLLGAAGSGTVSFCLVQSLSRPLCVSLCPLWAWAHVLGTEVAVLRPCRQHREGARECVLHAPEGLLGEAFPGPFPSLGPVDTVPLEPASLSCQPCPQPSWNCLLSEAKVDGLAPTVPAGNNPQ